MKSKQVNPFRTEIIELWHSLDEPKPTLVAFRAMCADKKLPVTLNTLRQWKHRGYLPGLIVGGNNKASAGAQMAVIVRKAQGDVREAARESGVFSKTMVREVVAKTMRCAEAFVQRVTEEAVKVKINDASDLAIVAGVAMQVMGRAAEVSENLQLLMVTEKTVTAEDKDNGPIDLNERRAKLAKNLGVK